MLRTRNLYKIVYLLYLTYKILKKTAYYLLILSYLCAECWGHGDLPERLSLQNADHHLH